MVRDSIPIAEIIMKQYLSNEVFPQDGIMHTDAVLSSSEAAPVNVIDEGLLVAEMIKSVHVIPYEGAPYDMSQLQIDSIFDKDLSTYMAFNVGDLWEITLKIPFGLKELFILDTDGVAIPFFWSYIEIDGTEHEFDFQGAPVGILTLDTKIVAFSVTYALV